MRCAMKRVSIGLALVGLLLIAGQWNGHSPAPGAKTPFKKDKHLWGRWTQVSSIYGSKNFVPVSRGTVRLNISANRIDCKDAGWRVHPGTYKVDPDKTPKTIDIFFAKCKSTPGSKFGDARQETMLGIYKVEGDKLTLCLDSFGHRRPKRFSPASENGYFTLKVFHWDKK